MSRVSEVPARDGQWQTGWCDDESSQLLDTNCAPRSGPGMDKHYKQSQIKVEMAKVISERGETTQYTAAILQLIKDNPTPGDISSCPWSVTAWLGWFR